MTLTNIDMWFFLLKSQNCFPRIVFSPKMSGGQLGFSRAVAGFIMQFIALSHT